MRPLVLCSPAETATVLRNNLACADRHLLNTRFPVEQGVPGCSYRSSICLDLAWSIHKRSAVVDCDSLQVHGKNLLILRDPFQCIAARPELRSTRTSPPGFVKPRRLSTSTPYRSLRYGKRLLQR